MYTAVSPAQAHPITPLSSFLPTVTPFSPAATDLTVRREGQLVYGPGIGDNCTGVAGLLALAEALSLHGIRPLADIWFVSNVGEEGLGDLRGMWAVVERFGGEAIYLVIEGGLFGQISHQAIGVQRYEITINTHGVDIPGGILGNAVPSMSWVG